MQRITNALASGRRTPLAWRNIVHNKVTLFISTAAMAFAVIIMFTELGFLNGLHDSQSGAVAALDADLVMVSRALHIFPAHETFARRRLKQAASFPGVKGAYAVYREDSVSYLRNPATGMRNAVRVLAFELDEPVFRSRHIRRLAESLRLPMTVLFDSKSRAFVGAPEAGTATELGERAVTVAGTFRLGPDYYYDGNVLTSAETFFTVFPHQQRENVYMGVIQLHDAASADAVLKELNHALRPDVEVFTQSALMAREKARLQKSTPAGYIFSMGVAVGFVIGVFICYQILYTDISDHLPQLATLKALGYQNRDLVGLVLRQALLLGVLGFVPAVLVTFGLYSILTALTGIVTQLTIGRAVFVFTLTLGMCIVSGLLAVRKALAADPAELF